MAPGFELIQFLNRIHPLHAELRFLRDGRNILNRRERSSTFVGIGHVVVQQRQIELHMHRLFIELARKIQPGFGRVDVLVEVQHQVVRDDRIARRKERHEPLDQMHLGGRQPLFQIDKIGRKIDFLHCPRVLDRRRETCR